MSRYFIVAALTACLAGCGGNQASPVAPTIIREYITVGPSASPPPPAGPHFALEIQAMNAQTYEGDPWEGTVSVLVNPQIIRPELPARVVTTCGTQTQVHGLGSGSARFSCLLPLGSHSIGAVAEMGDGRRYPTAIAAHVLERPIRILPLYYDVSLSSRDWTDVSFGFQTFADVTYHWDFGDGDTATTLLGGVSHRYGHPGDERSKERKASVRVTKDGKTIATGSVVGIW